MSSFNLLPGDKYDGRCAEIYITEKQFLIYHCSACEAIFTTFTELLCHITKDHYKNTKELSKADMKNVETANKQDTNKENQFTTHNLYVKERNQNNDFEKQIGNKDEQYINKFFLCKFCETAKLKTVEKVNPLLHPSKSLSQRKKRTGNIKSNAIGSVNTLTHYQATANDERKYLCAICGFAFKEKYNLSDHMMRHSNQNRISCCTICSKKFFTKVELYLHECRHKSDRQYVCDRCGMVFISWISLTQHFRKHHSLHQLFKCDQYFKLSSSFHQAKDYKILNSEINTECPLSFNYRFFLKNHKQQRECELNSGNELFAEKNKISTNENKYKYTQDDNSRECEFVLEQNFDEYELVQTLSDLECSKHM